MSGELAPLDNARTGDADVDRRPLCAALTTSFLMGVDPFLGRGAGSLAIGVLWEALPVGSLVGPADARCISKPG